MQLEWPTGTFDVYLFDCDGTIADSMPVHLRAWQAELAEHGCDFTEEEHNALAGTPTRRIVEILNERRGLAMDPAAVCERKEARYYELLPTVQPIPEVVDIIRRDTGRKRMAVVSGSPRESVEKTLTLLGLLDRFEVIVAAGETPRGKPHPDPFLKAAELLGVPAATCIVFEDSQLGIRAAEDAGMKWVYVPSHELSPTVKKTD